MYEELVERLISVKDSWQTKEENLMLEAADAMDDMNRTLDGLEADNDSLCEQIDNLRKPRWIKIESRPMTEEERKEWSEHIGYDIEYEDAIIYTSKLPDDGQEVLVCSKWGHVWIDTFSNDPDYGVGFETNGDMDGLVAWMPLPEPPKEET